MIYWIRQYFSNPSAHWSAFAEVITTVIFSLAPIIVPFLIRMSNDANAETSNELVALAGRGQMFLLAYGVFGTVFWLAFMKGDRPRHDARVVLGLIATVAMIPVVGFMGVDPTFSTIVRPGVLHASYWFYAGLVFIYYLLLFYLHISPPQAADILEREAADMRTRYEGLNDG